MIVYLCAEHWSGSPATVRQPADRRHPCERCADVERRIEQAARHRATFRTEGERLRSLGLPSTDTDDETPA